MGRKNLDRYSEAEWREASRTVDQILRNRWPVIAECPVCELRIEVNVRRIARAKGPGWSLWGADAPCRRIGCIGRVYFILRPRGAIMEYVMTAKAVL